jgi:peptidoglycan/LPS O-acetylase OafA/YrhL
LFGLWGFISFNFVVLVLIGSASWFLYENPINNLKRFFPYVGAHRRRLIGGEELERNQRRHGGGASDVPDISSRPLYSEQAGG